MFRNIIRPAMAIALFTATLGNALVPEQAEGAETIAPDGPYPVGVKIAHMNHQGRDMRLIIWYPAQPQPGGISYRYATQTRGSAFLDAPPDGSGRPYPLLLFSHGATACGIQSVYYTENLASFGYVVVAPDHDDSMSCHIEGDPDISVWRSGWAIVRALGELSGIVEYIVGDYLRKIGYDLSYRAVEASAVIDRVLEWNRDPTSILSGMITEDKIGVTGHSLGGFTTLMLSGLPFSCDGEEWDPGSCSQDKEEVDLFMSPCCMDFIREAEDPFKFRDERVKAILPLAPPMFVPNLERAAAGLPVPVMIISGDRERMEVPWEPIRTFYENAPAPKYAIRLRKTDHLTIADFTRALPMARFIMPGFRSDFHDKAQAYKDYSVAFFNVHLKGRDEPILTCRNPSNAYVELWSETE